MPYIGNDLATQFQAFATQTITGDGSTSYTLDRAVANGKELLVYINNVKQEEGSGKSYEASGTTITFSEAVASGDSCYLVYMGSAQQTVTAPAGSIVSSQLATEFPSASLDMNGTELILDADGDTTITSDTDDQIDIKMAGNDQVVIATGSTAFKAPDGGNRYALNGMGNSDSAELSLYDSSDAQKVRIGAGADTFFNYGKVGIGTTSPVDVLDVVVGTNARAIFSDAIASTGTGNLTIQVSNSADNALKPFGIRAEDIRMVIGSTESMRIDSIGAVTKPLQPAFQVKATANTSFAINTEHTVVWGTEVFDQNNDFASNTFTAPVTGRYQLSFLMYFSEIPNDSTYFEVRINTSNTTYTLITDPECYDQTLSYHTFTQSVLADMDAGDTATVSYRQNVGTQQANLSVSSFFSGFLAC